MFSIETLAEAVGKIGWVSPNYAERVKRKKMADDCYIAVKVKGIQYSWGKYLYRVEPVAGVGSWNVEHTRVLFDREELDR